MGIPVSLLREEISFEYFGKAIKSIIPVEKIEDPVSLVSRSISKASFFPMNIQGPVALNREITDEHNDEHREDNIHVLKWAQVPEN